MKKILMSVVMIGLFYGCASREEPKKDISMLKNIESYEKSYKEGKIKRLLDPNREVLVDLEEFFALSKEERKIRAKKAEKDLKKAKKLFWAKAGITFNENDSDDVKSEKITNQTLTQLAKSLPPSIGKKILKDREEEKKAEKNGSKEKKIINNAMIDLGITPPLEINEYKDENTKELMELLLYVIPDDEKIKYRLKENRMLLLRYSPVINQKERDELYNNLYNDKSMKIATKIKNVENISKEENIFLIKNIMKYKNDLSLLVINKSFIEIEKMSDNSLAKIEKIISDESYNIPKTLIFYAIEKANLKLVKILVENKKIGLNITMKESNTTPIEYASSLGFKHIVDYLKTKL